MILVLGLMVELSWLSERRFEAQSASDLAARSALAKLYDNTGSLDSNAITSAKGVGLEVYESNFPTGDVSDQELLFGEIANGDFKELSSQSQLRRITASELQYQQEFTSLLGTLDGK